MNIDQDYFIFLKCNRTTMYNRTFQFLYFKCPVTKEVFSTSLKNTIDLSSFKKGDKMRFILKISRQGSLNKIKFNISGVMLLNNEEVSTFDR
ncbi:hypothetical protein [Enterococcus dispar]|jgi:hypothetical protein|uniref:hypothetical protein n=1 Tax=Enterococcus dispar TaxID=44009 RepID=UPI00189EF406|nr:hypothetical protein [Enterococcus dispar]